MNDLRQFYDQLAPVRENFLKRNAYYYRLLYYQYRYLIPTNKRVLEVGCGTGELLNAVQPAQGVGIDISSQMIKIAREKYPRLHFETADISTFKSTETFDYIILSGLLGELDDIQDFLIRLKPFCNSQTRIIIEYYSHLWIFFSKLAEKLKIKIPQAAPNWLTPKDVSNFLYLTGFETIKAERKILFPFKIPIVSFLLNKYLGNIPPFDAFTLSYFIAARALLPSQGEFSASIVIPCRNEKGNIEAAIQRTPMFGSAQEFIFVEGGSTDGTAEEIQRVMATRRDKDIKFFKQTGKGKGDAVRLGFAQAKYEILMILDADLTVAPEDLPKFYYAIRDNRGEFINGCRLVYPMENQAMRFLNLVANRLFSLFFTWLVGQDFKDTLCGTKVLYKSQYEELAHNREYFGDFDPFGDFDLIFGASKLNLKITELPIRYKERQYGQTQIRRFYHGILLFRMCLFALGKIKFR